MIFGSSGLEDEDDGRQDAFLVAYDYGTGGLWGAMLARSEAEIKSVYPELGIAHERPPWMTDDRYEQICAEELHDIDDKPWGILEAVLADRAKN
jgi:hypothetical protein